MFSSFLIPFCFVGSSAEVIIECSAIEQVVFSVSESDNVHANTKTSTVFSSPSPKGHVSYWYKTKKIKNLKI
jgi:hypothetical protein